LNKENPMSGKRSFTRTVRVVTVILGVLSLGTALALAQGDPRGFEHHEPGTMHQLQWVVGSLGLTPVQQVAIDKLFTGHHDTAEAAFKSFMAAKKALGDQVRAETLDEGAIRQAAAAVAALEADQAVSDATILSEVRAQLTPEQRTQLQQKLTEHQGMNTMGPKGPRDRDR
jgi:Spy/CpxP family protein refolding chaperone